LPLDDIRDMSLVVTDPELIRYTCAPIRPQLGVVARFDDEVKGFISISPQVVGSILQVNLTGLSGKAGGYHVHRFPVSNSDCSTTSGHFNPFNVAYGNQSSLGDGSSDQFEVGDLSGLFGSLAGTETAAFTTFSRNLLSEGLHGILGRSIVIHFENGSRWQCATIDPLSPHGEAIKRHAAVARFQGEYQGYVRMTQYEIGTGIFTGTVVEIDVRHREGNATFDHKWHVHQNPAAAYGGVGEGNCAFWYAGDHYNPENVDLETDYNDDCRPENQLRCELGDLSGKHGKYTIHPRDSALGRRQTYDSSLPLTGRNGVIHRSVVIHEANSGSGRIACATLYPADTQGLSVTFRKPKVASVYAIKRAIAKSLSLVDSTVQYVHFSSDESNTCVSVTFAVPNTVVESLNGQDFPSYLAQRGGTCGKFVVESDCLDWPNVDEDALAMVHINGDGILGQLDIDGMLDGSVSFRFRSLKAFGRSLVDDIEIAIHTLPPLYRGSCLESELGPIYDPTNATVIPQYNESCRMNPTTCAVGDLRPRLGTVSLGRRVTVFPDRRNFLEGPHSIIGRSLVLYNVTTGRPITCALIIRRLVGTVEPVREMSLHVKLLAPIAGTVTFTQGINDQTGKTYETQIIASLFANDRSVPSGQYTWQLVNRQAGHNDDCQKIVQMLKRNSCHGNTKGDCHFSNLTGKHGHVPVHWGRSHRVLYTDTDLPLENVTGMALILADASGSNISCGTVTPQVGVRALFSDQIKGSIMCTPTHGGASVDVHLSNLKGLAGGYHVHRYPVSNGDCHSTGGHLNPFNITRSPRTGEGSDDQFEVGDLSGIFGSLAGQKSVEFHRFAPNVYCEQILGRSIVIHYTNGDRWQCASLEPVLADGTDPDEVEWTRHSAVAHFVGYHEGYVKLTQWERGDVSFFTNTVVDVNVYTKENMSVGHKFHIHQKPVAGFDGMSSKNCDADFTGGHYNPLDIDLKTNYSEECNEHSQLRCEVGDLSSKHGLYSFYPRGENGRRLTSDELLPLTGLNSVMLRSVVFHAEKQGAARVACATLYPEGHKPFSVTLSTPKKMDL
jgi:Cu/Zn superoxide dismutase